MKLIFLQFKGDQMSIHLIFACGQQQQQKAARQKKTQQNKLLKRPNSNKLLTYGYIIR